MPKPVTPRSLDVFGDDSSTSEQFVLYGTVACETDDTPALLEELARCGGPSEFKWNDLTESDYDAYVRFVDVLFDWIEDRKLDFRCIVVDTSKANYKEFTEGSRTLALEKYAYLLLYTHAKNHARRSCSIVAYLDEGDPNYSREFMKLCLNRRDRSEHGHDYDVFQLVKDVQSRDYPLVQAADVLAGAVGYYCNKRFTAKNAAAHPLALARHIAARAMIRVTAKALRDKGMKPGDLETLGLHIDQHISASRGFGIWRLDWDKERENELQALSRDQLAHFPRTSTFADVAASGFRVDMVCSRCNRGLSENILQYRPELGARRVDDPKRPRCGSKVRGAQCVGRGVILLHPDPLMPIFAPRPD